jgi:hypothetical protein
MRCGLGPSRTSASHTVALIVPLLLWFALMLYCSIDLLLPYFQEPWNA